MPASVKREQRPTALMNPDTMAQLGLADGDPVRLGNERGFLVPLHAKGRPGQQETMIVVASIWPNADRAEGIGVKLLLRADPAPSKGGAVIHDTAAGWSRHRIWRESASNRPRPHQTLEVRRRYMSSS